VAAAAHVPSWLCPLLFRKAQPCFRPWLTFTVPMSATCRLSARSFAEHVCRGLVAECECGPSAVSGGGGGAGAGDVHPAPQALSHMQNVYRISFFLK